MKREPGKFAGLKGEEGSLIVALVVVLVVLILFAALITSISVALGFTTRVHVYNSSIQEANAAVSDAAFQLDQYTGATMADLPQSFCVSSLTPTPSGCVADTFGTNGPNAGWTYYAQEMLPPPAPDLVAYQVTAYGYYNGSVHKVHVTFYRLVAHDGLTGLWGLNANGSLCIYPTNSTGQYVDTDNDSSSGSVPSSCSGGQSYGDGDNDSDDWSSAGVNQGAVGCGGLVTGQGFVNIYGRSTAGTANCNGQPTGTAPLNPQNPSPTCPPPVNTVPPTPCVPPNNGSNYFTGGTSSDPNCPPNGVFTGTVQADVYICHQPITLTPPISVSGSANNGQVQIFVFLPSGFSGPADVTFNGGGGINAGGSSLNFEVYVSEPNLCGPPSNGGLPSPYQPQGGGAVVFNAHGSNIPGPIDAVLYAPNDQVNVNGAPFTSWVGNILLCYMNINGGGHAKATLYDDIFYDTVYSPWYTAGYTD